MSAARKILILSFLLVLLSLSLAHIVSAQDNRTGDLTRENIIIESQRSLDRSLSILDTVATLIGVLVALITIIIAIVGITGVSKLKEWNKAIEQVKEEADSITQLRNRAEEDANALRSEIGDLPVLSLTEIPSEEKIEKLDEFIRKFEILEMIGVSLKPEDYMNRGHALYYKGKYYLALEAYEKAIELKPDYAEAWNNKGFALGELDRNDEALKAYEKAIELKPDDAETWNSRARAYAFKGEMKMALSDLKRAVELDSSFKEMAKKDENFETLWEDEEFNRIVG